MMLPTWDLPPEMLQLQFDEVHIWRVWLDLPLHEIESMQANISKDEKERAEKFYLLKDRNRFIAAHSCLRQILGKYLNQQPNAIRYIYNENGKPELDPGIGQLRFNLSHSDSVGLLAISKNMRLGIDVERIKQKENFEAIAQRFFSPGEVEQLLNQPESHRDEAFFCCWTRKEAYIKALGVGMLIPLNQFEVAFEPGMLPKMKHIGGDEVEAARWNLYHLNPKEGYVGALAVEGKPAEIKYFQMSGWTES